MSATTGLFSVVLWSKSQLIYYEMWMLMTSANQRCVWLGVKLRKGTYFDVIAGWMERGTHIEASEHYYFIHLCV